MGPFPTPCRRTPPSSAAPCLTHSRRWLRVALLTDAPWRERAPHPLCSQHVWLALQAQPGTPSWAWAVWPQPAGRRLLGHPWGCSLLCAAHSAQRAQHAPPVHACRETVGYGTLLEAVLKLLGSAPPPRALLLSSLGLLLEVRCCDLALLRSRGRGWVGVVWGWGVGARSGVCGCVVVVVVQARKGAPDFASTGGQPLVCSLPCRASTPAQLK